MPSYVSTDLLGKRANEDRTRTLQSAGQGEQELRNTEATRTAAEQGLGSDAQLNGQLETGGEKYSGGWQAGGPLKKGQQAKLDQANDLRRQAATAAANGDQAGADALYAQGEAIIKGFKPKVGAFITDRKDPGLAANKMLSSQEGLAVGALVRDAKDLQNRESDAYKDFYRSLTEGAVAAVDAGVTSGERSIAAQQRQANADARELSAGRGAGRNPYAERALRERSNEAFAAQRADMQLKAGVTKAQIYSDASKNLEVYSRQFAQDAVGFAQQWLSNSGGIRDNFSQMMQAVKAGQTELYSHMADQNQAAMLQAKQLHTETRAARAKAVSDYMSSAGSLMQGMSSMMGAGASM